MLLQVVQDVRDPGFRVVLARKVMGLFLVQLFGKHMLEDLGAEGFQQGVLRLKMCIEGRPAHIRQVDDLLHTLGMVVLDIAAPIFLMIGLKRTTAANASLLNNFEIVATSLIALFIFKEKIGKRLWIAIGLITLSSILLSVEDASSFQFSFGSLFVLAACVCWGLENNCTRNLSHSDPLEIVVIKGFGSGIGSVIIGLVVGEALPLWSDILKILLLGFVAYGLSIYFYVYAQRDLGAAKTSAYYAVAPFIGVALSFIIFREIPGPLFFIALVIMIAGTWMVDRAPAGD